jgi:hypothetical protein
MESTGILTTLASVSMTFVGFTALLIALRGGRPQGSWDAFQRFQFTIVIAHSLTAVFGSLGVIVIAGLIGEVPALRLAGAALAVIAIVLANFARTRSRLVRPGERRRDRVPFLGAVFAATLAFLVESVVPNLALYELGLLLLLVTPALVFRFVVTNLGGGAD